MNRLLDKIAIISTLYLLMTLSVSSSELPSHEFYVPYLPPEHVLCWLRSQSESFKLQFIDLCKNGDLNLIKIIDNKASYLRDLCDKVVYLFSRNQTLPCWGYENKLDKDCLLYKPDCSGSSESWSSSKAEQFRIFYETADFGYVRSRRNELQYYCTPNSSASPIVPSVLSCTKFMRFCFAKNIYINFSRFATLKEPIRYREDIVEYGDIGGWNCHLDRKSLLNEGDHKSSLMSWYSEISNFKVISDNSEHQICDIWINKPTYIMKLDATINMYHHFCDFINLYISLHVNNSNINMDNNILIWDSHGYRSNFAQVWKAFTLNPILSLNNFRGKVVCFKDVLFPLLPRMIYGLYYNLPLIPGCSQSGIFRAFNRHLLFHLKQKSTEQLFFENSIQITFISRQTKYRKVLNENELINALRQTLKNQNELSVDIQVAQFNHHMPFDEQVKITSASDILIGMHGAGLTHTLLQPDYGVLFELFNCDDVDCYKDLAHLRGAYYMTWRNRSKLISVDDLDQMTDQESPAAAHAKFVNYYFDVDEFVHLSLDAINIARERKRKFKESQKDYMVNIKNEINFNRDEL